MVKLFINSTLSTPNTRFVNADLANFYLEMPMERPEYIKIIVKVIPLNIMQQ
eukprot:CAMPEP_0202455102 /NCGR_PEP_ID=MMETSP1360-20130828/12708_1 /ASSEMBLY_ACC=CAM_ASM_000848 /TAXON_ID=515479 /ORGANISM="Licmophora paradoxa, Strain CCMP2313" /LENGTH=51 /DNA_ID=CAMNT_0049074599 /DNA_START=1153 /DNA_END=1308 /DNA_ORIENTATION=-